MQKNKGKFSRELFDLVTRSGMTQREFAEKLGVSLRTLESWLAGTRNPKASTQPFILGRAKRFKPVIRNEKKCAAGKRTAPRKEE